MQVLVGSLVSAVQRHFAPLRSKLDLLRFSVPAGELHVFADPSRIFQVLVHLVSNALAYTGGGAVTVRAARASGKHGAVRITVRDPGPGVAPEYFQVRRPGNSVNFSGV